MYRVSKFFVICLICVTVLLVACGGAEDVEETAVSPNQESAAITDDTASAPEPNPIIKEAPAQEEPAADEKSSTTISDNPDMAEVEEAVDNAVEDMTEEMLASMEAGEELDGDAISDMAEEAIEENFSDMLDEDQYGDIDIEDLPLPLACEILEQLDLESFAGGPVAPPEETYEMPTIEGAPYHVSTCAYYTPVELENTEPTRTVSLFITQPKPGAPVFSPEKQLEMLKEGMVSFLEIEEDEIDIEIEPGFDGIAFWNFEQFTLYREDGSSLIFAAGEGYMGTPQQTVEFARAVESVLP